MTFFLKKEFLLNASLFIFSLVVVLLTSDYPFYWDNTVQISIPANWYFANDFSNFFLPDSIATGHPTFVGMYFALIWEIFNRSLFYSHIAMLPFVFGLLYQINLLLKNLEIKKILYRVIILLFVILDTTFLAQLSLITFDVIQLFFFFCCINCILKSNSLLLSVVFSGLMLTSLRGTICAGGVMIFNLLYQYLFFKKINIKFLYAYIPGVLCMIIFLVAFKINKGWLIHNTVSNKWSDSGKFADLYGVVRNSGIFIWRLIDYGRVAIYLIFTYLIVRLIRKHNNVSKNVKLLILIAVSQLAVFYPIIVIYQNPFAHRYLLPIIITITLATIIWCLYDLKKWKYYLLIAFISLLSGHFWLYPEKISQGWDGSTIHWSYFNGVKKMNKYVSENNFDKSKIGTYFSLYQSDYYARIENDTLSYKKANPLINEYIIYSNAFNVSDGAIDSLKTPSLWTEIKSFKHNQIFVKLYKKNYGN